MIEDVNATQPNRRLNTVVDKPFCERHVASREDQARDNSFAELSSARVNSLFGTRGDHLLQSGVEKSIANKLLWAHDDGSPVAPSDEFGAIEMATIARRRWNSFARRHKNIPKTQQARIEDLARGLAEKFTDGGWPMVGPLITDYRWLAEQITPLLDAADQTEIRQGDLPAN